MLVKDCKAERIADALASVKVFVMDIVDPLTVPICAEPAAKAGSVPIVKLFVAETAVVLTKVNWFVAETVVVFGRVTLGVFVI